MCSWRHKYTSRDAHKYSWSQSSLPSDSPKPLSAKLSSTISFRSRAVCPNCSVMSAVNSLLPGVLLSNVDPPNSQGVYGCTHIDLQTYRLTLTFVVQQPTFLTVLCCLFVVLSFIQFTPPLFFHTYSPFSDHPPAVYLERYRMSSRHLSYVLLGVSPAKDPHEGEVGDC